MATTKQATHRTGKRKTAIARVFFTPRSGTNSEFRVNDRTLEDYFPRETLRRIIMKPLEITQTAGMYDIRVTVVGGGLSGQAGAVRHGVARTLTEIDITHRPVLKKAGLLTRDSREVERKKYGISGARKRYQYSKR